MNTYEAWLIIITSIEACNVCLSSCAIRWSRVSIFLVGRILLGILYIFNWHRCFDCDIHTLFKSKGAFTPLLQKSMFNGYEVRINILIINYFYLLLPLLDIPGTLFLKFNVWVKVTNKYQSLYILTQIARIHANKRIEKPNCRAAKIWGHLHHRRTAGHHCMYNLCTLSNSEGTT